MIDVNGKALEKAQKFLADFPKDLPKITSRALNRASQAARTAGVKELRKEYTAKAGDINKTIKPTRATAGNLKARLRSTGPAIPLIQFKTNPSKPSRQRARRLLQARVKKGAGGKIKGAFVATGKKSNKTNVFVRRSKKSYPIQPLFGPSAPQMLSSQNVRDVMEKRSLEQFDKRLEQELNALLGGYTK